MLSNIFVKENINTGRQPELDFARGLAVLFMIAVHVLEEFSSELVYSSVPGTIIAFLGSPPAAPVFMFILGTGLVYSKKQDAKSLFKRGLFILAAGYVLNILRGVLPYTTAYLLSGSREFLSISAGEFISIDILQFAGLAFLFFAFISFIKIRKIWLPVFLLIFCILNLLLVNIKTGHFILSAFTGLIWGSNEFSYFPFLSWIIYPAAGYLWGSLLIKCKNKDLFYLICLITNLLLLFLFFFLFMILMKMDAGFDDPYNYYHHTLPGNLLFVSFIFSWITALYFAAKPLKGWIKSTVGRWSRNVMQIYVIHWIFIGWLSLFIQNSGYKLSIILFTGIFLISDLSAAWYLELCRKKSPPGTIIIINKKVFINITDTVFLKKKE